MCIIDTPTTMKVLLVTNMYPTPSRPNYGIFVSEQAAAVTAAYPDVEYDVAYIPGVDSKLAYLKSIFQIKKRIDKGAYDLVHVHYGLSGLFLLNPFLKKIPVVVTLHGGDIQIEQGKNVQVAITKKVLKRSDVAITLNDNMDAIAGAICPRIEKIPCSVDIDTFSPPATRQALSRERCLSIIFPSSPERTVKNYPLFQATLGKLKERHGICAKELILWGMPRTEVAQHMRMADILLMTSISEGSPQVVKEAMACNLPVVSTDVGDVNILLEGVSDSICCRENSPEALADSIAEVIDGKVSGIKSGRECILELGLDNNSIASRVYNVYNSILQ